MKINRDSKNWYVRYSEDLAIWINKNLPNSYWAGGNLRDGGIYAYEHTADDRNKIFLCSGENGRKEISFEQFLKIMDDNITRESNNWCIKGSKELKNWVANNIIGSYWLGDDQMRYYYIDFLAVDKNKLVCCNSIEKGRKEISFEQFLNIMNQHHIGYKLKAEYEKYNKLAAHIAYGSNTSEQKLASYLEGYHFDVNSSAEKNFIAYGVLDEWFDKIYVIRQHTMSMRSDSGPFDIRITSEGIYYDHENQEIFIQQMIDALHANNLKYVDNKLYIGYHVVKITRLDVGCKKGTYLEDWEKALDIHNKMKEDKVNNNTSCSNGQIYDSYN